MKKTLIITATAVIFGTVLIAYLLKRKKKNVHIPIPLANNCTHHLTNVFANAKKHKNTIRTDGS